MLNFSAVEVVPFYMQANSGKHFVKESHVDNLPLKQS